MTQYTGEMGGLACDIHHTTFNGPIYDGIFSNICSLLPSPNFPSMIAATQHGFRSLFAISFQARPPVYALKRAHFRAKGAFSGYHSSLCQSFPTRFIYI
jgi:hypothetical protein